MTRSLAWSKLPWSLSEIRRLGDWGHASNHLGSAWEQFAAERLLHDGQPWALPGGGIYRPRAVVPFGLDREFGPKLSSAGKRAPDAFVVGLVRGAPVIQPVDFKFSLDHAEAGQISVEVAVAAGELVGPALAEQLGTALKQLPLHHWPTYVVAGVLVAPPSSSNRRARVPGRPTVRWLPTAIEEFFPQLPAAPVAEWLATLDGVAPIRHDFDLAEAYYRLGAAVAGAIGRLARPLFSDNTESAPATLEAIEAWRAAHRVHSAAEMVEALRPLIAERRVRESRLHQLLRRPASREALNLAVGQPPDAALDTWPPAARRALLGALTEDRAAVLLHGEALIAAGKSEDQALDALQADYRQRSERFLRRLRELAT
ncbi:MAG: hypothetical protein KatS3mg060_3670 [Dehalococcoidia bacterium]|nr:MAG: hypothetical protein KatS3mg060_3670 [Dehalococcoidia bacterium]